MADPFGGFAILSCASRFIDLGREAVLRRRGLHLRRGVRILSILCLAWTGTLAPTQDRFKARNYRVRIGVQHQVEGLAIQGSGPYQVVASTGKPLLNLKAHEPYFVQISRGRPGDKRYRLVLREMDTHRQPEAMDLARAAMKAHGLPVKVLRLVSRERSKSHLIVTLGEFQSIEAAREYHGRLNSETIQYIYEDRSRARGGLVRLLDRDGSVLARDEKLLRVVPLNLSYSTLRVMESDADKTSRVDLRKARHYRGEIELTINEEGTLTAVNDLWVEYYLYSVVAGEIGQDAPLESLKAQAVAARSEAVAKIQREIVSSSFFDFFDTALAQVYRGYGDESERVRRAVDATRGEILVWNGGAADAVYGHSCGGVVASSRDVWGGINEGYAETRIDRLVRNQAPNLSKGSVAHDWTSRNVDALCNPKHDGFPKYAKKYFRWTKSFTGKEYSKLANERLGAGSVRNVIVAERKPSGRVTKLKVVGTKRTVTLNKHLEIRRALGGVYSTFFTVISERDDDGGLERLTVYGGGYGHGVGMCQMGAFIMGRMGYNYRQVLAHYYSEVKLRRLYR